MEYPDNCIRGVRSKEFFLDSGLVATSAFQFEKNSKRQDDFLEVSVNWEDAPSVMDFTLNQRKGDSEEFEFKGGIAVLSIRRLSDILPSEVDAGRLTYERSPMEGNPYHGNMLLKGSVDTQTKKLIIAGICLAVVDTRRR